MKPKMQVKILLDYAKYKLLLKHAESNHDKKISLPNIDNMEGAGLAPILNDDKQHLDEQIIEKEEELGKPKISVENNFNSNQSEVNLKSNTNDCTASCGSSNVNIRNIEQKAIEKVPKCYKNKLKIFLIKLKSHNDVIRYDRENNVYIRNKLLPKAKFSDLIALFFSRRIKKYTPGALEFYNALKHLGLDNLIINKKCFEPEEEEKEEGKEDNTLESNETTHNNPWYFIG